MEENIKKIVELEIDINDLELDDLGVEVVSLVTEPAIEVDFLAFNKQNFVTPTSGESEDEFIGRCIPKLLDEGYDQDQATAICYNYWEQKHCQECSYEFESYSDYPDAVRNNAKRGIELNEKVDNKCATRVGKIRAQQLANGENISLETIKRMYSYLSRAEVYYNESDTEACGTISYLLWGGKAALRWSESKLKQLGQFEDVVKDYSEEEIEDAILEWAEESGQEIKDDHVFIDINELNFESESAITKGLQALKIINRIKNNQDAETMYKYTGPTAQRPFCASMLRLNKMYNKSDMKRIKQRLGQLNPGMGLRGNDRYDVFKYKGGVSCRHYWSKLSVFKNQYGQKVIIDHGPAEGNAGKSNNGNMPSPAGSVTNNASVSKQFSFSVMDEEKRIVAGPLMIPNSMILRRTPAGDPYYVFFSKDTIRRIQERFNKNLNQNNTDTQHDGNIKKDNIMLEQWIVEHPTYDKSKYYGFDNLKKGTWFGVYKINNEDDWRRVKNGELRGFSIAGQFTEKYKPVPSDEETLDKILNILKEIK